MGQLAVSFLNRLDERTLNAEQRSRIRQIKQSFHIDDGDTPDRVAAWLSEDKSVWLSLLERKSEATRTIAAGQLGEILGQSLAFDPAADDDRSPTAGSASASGLGVGASDPGRRHRRQHAAVSRRIA